MIKWLGHALAFVVGALFAYLFDPVAGKARRARLRDQSVARSRDVTEEITTRARYEADRVRGVIHDLRSPSDDAPRNDSELLQKVRSEALGPSNVPGSIEVHVDDGAVVLQGESADPGGLRDLIGRIQKVTGVRDVRNEVVPG